MTSSSKETKKRELPGSPWRPERPRSWLSMRRASCRSVPMMCRPPAVDDAVMVHLPGPARFAADLRRLCLRQVDEVLPALAGDLFRLTVRVAAEDDVGATAGHVRGDRDGAETPACATI